MQSNNFAYLITSECIETGEFICASFENNSIYKGQRCKNKKAKLKQFDSVNFRLFSLFIDGTFPT